MSPENQPQLDYLIINGKIKRAGELLAQGDYFAAARVLPAVNTFEVMRLRLLIENSVKNEDELAHLRETPLMGSETFQNLLSVCDDEQRELFLHIDEACTLNEAIRAELERGYELIAYEYFNEAAAFAAGLAETYPDRAEVWNMIILAKSKIIPARDFAAPVLKRNASLEKFSEYKELIACSDFRYLTQRPEYAERYLKTKADIIVEKNEQVVREKTALSVVFSRVTLGLGLFSLLLLFPYFLFFDSVGGVVIGVFGVMVAIAAVVCNVRVNMLDTQKPLRESTRSYTLLFFLIVAYVIVLCFGIPMAL